jgi:glycosyltransferase involved in cell wall biosynthesis
MHIILLNRWFPPETGGGGVATHNAFFAAACVRLGHRVTVIASGSTSSTTVNPDGVTVIRVPLPVLHKWRRIPVLGRCERALGMLLYSWRVTRLLAPFNAPHGAVVIEAADINAEAFFWNANQHPPLVIRCHTPSFMLEHPETTYTASNPADMRLLVWAEKRALRRAHGWTAPSMDMADVIARGAGIARERIAAIPNAVDVDFFAPAPQPRTTSDDATILWVGRLDPGKGLDVMTAAIPRVLADAPRAKFAFIGGSRRLSNGRNTLDVLGERFAAEIARGQIELRGFVDDADLPAAYHASDIAVVPSLIYESFSYTCAQAIACGVPVVASQIGGISETLGGGAYGVLTPPGDADALARAILTLIHDPARRRSMGAAGRAHSIDAFQSESVARATLAYYQHVLERVR